MQKYSCRAAGCRNDAVFRLFEPQGERDPAYLCCAHWNELRIRNALAATRYGSIEVLGPLAVVRATEREEAFEEPDWATTRV